MEPGALIKYSSSTQGHLMTIHDEQARVMAAGRKILSSVGLLLHRFQHGLGVNLAMSI
jgi:hypothetical protein